MTFEFNPGGSIKVTHAVRALRVELYRTVGDLTRLALELVISAAAIYNIVELVMDMYEARQTTGSAWAFFRSAWLYVEAINVLLALERTPSGSEAWRRMVAKVEVKGEVTIASLQARIMQFSSGTNVKDFKEK